MGIVDELLATVRSSGRSEEAPVRLESQQAELRLGVSLVRQDGSSLFLVRLLARHAEPVSGGEEGALLMPQVTLVILPSRPERTMATACRNRRSCSERCCVPT